jgi:hypothetical protein
MRERWIVALVVLQFAIILGGALFIGEYLMQSYQNQMLKQMWNSSRSYPDWSQPGLVAGTRNITVIHYDRQLYQGAYKPYITTINVTAQSYNTSAGMSRLLLNGFINNTGDGTAYGLKLNVRAISYDGKVLNTDYDLGGLTPHMSLKLEKSLNCNFDGSAIANCTLTPVYLDKGGMLNQGPINNASALRP